MNVCYVFPGQGSQKVRMGKQLYEAYPDARRIFKTGNDILGRDITDLIFNGSEEELKKTVNCQPAMLIVNMAYHSALKDKILPSYVLGHSLGEYSALVAADSLSLEDALRLVKIRAELVSQCIPDEELEEKTSHMAAVITDNHELVYSTCDIVRSGIGVVQVANINSPAQIVISGNNKAVISVVEYLQDKGVKSIYLPVEGPYHSDLMISAADGLGDALREVEIRRPNISFIPNVSAEPVSDPGEIRRLLKEQVYNTVRWSESIERVIREGAEVFIESGPGKVQNRLIKRNYKQVRVIDADGVIGES